MSEQIRIVIVDDHPIVRKGLRQEIEEQADLRVAGEAGDGESGLKLIRELRPHVAVLDVEMPKRNGFAVAREIYKSNFPIEIIFLTFHGEVDMLHEAMDLGAKGYIVKESALTDIVNGIRSVLAGRAFVSPSMATALLERRAQALGLERNTPALAQLTPSERRILSMIASGKSTKAIAAELHIHPRTVESHRGSICQKLELNGTNSLLRFALEHKAELLA